MEDYDKMPPSELVAKWKKVHDKILMLTGPALVQEGDARERRNMLVEAKLSIERVMDAKVKAAGLSIIEDKLVDRMMGKNRVTHTRRLLRVEDFEDFEIEGTNGFEHPTHIDIEHPEEFYALLGWLLNKHLPY